MSDRTGLGVLEVSVLQAVGDLGAVPEAGYRKTLRVLDRLERDHGIGPRYAYPLMQDLGAPWRLHLPLLDHNGNWGSLYGDPAADARYTEVRLSPVGALALAAERGQVSPVPLGLVEGSLYRDGPVPPFDPHQVVAALRHRSADAGPPALPTGGTVDGDVGALLAGRKARLLLGCRIVHEKSALVVTNVPLGVPVDRVEQNLASRGRALRLPGSRRAVRDAEGHHADGRDLRTFGFVATQHAVPEPGSAPEQSEPERPEPFGIVDVRDESTMRTGVRIVVLLSEGSDPVAAERWMRSIWPVMVEVDCRLPAPMTTLLRSWDAGDGSGVDALESLLA